MASTAEVDAMGGALTLARSVDGPTHPNPRVGAVVLAADGRRVGEGAHRGAGHPHAEIEALGAAGADARGGTVVVTLEPCAHTGRTGPCTDALTAAGIRRVVFGQIDPNPLAQGGAQLLQAAGVDVEAGCLRAEVESLNQAWTLAMRRRRPYVVWKVAGTADGRVAAADGTSRWITGESARREVHALRAAADAVIVGTGTVVADDPQLTARTADGTLCLRQPLRVVVGRRELDPRSRVLDGSAQTLQVTSHSPDAVLSTLFEHDVHLALLEGGPTVAAAFLRVGAVDAVIAYTAPVLVGAGPSVLADVGVPTLSAAPRFSFTDVRVLGSDIRWSARLSDAPLLEMEGAR